jgi:hypothetical protein
MRTICGNRIPGNALGHCLVSANLRIASALQVIQAQSLAELSIGRIVGADPTNLPEARLWIISRHMRSCSHRQDSADELRFPATVLVFIPNGRWWSFRARKPRENK